AENAALLVETVSDVETASFDAVNRAVGDRFEPRRLSRWLFGVAAAGLTFGLLPLTRSRGALLCALVAALGAFFASRLPRRAKIAAAIAAGLVLVAGAWYVHRAGRGFSSGAERLDYLATTAKLVAAHPLTGSGWNGFFRAHMRVKSTGTDEAAHDPHNFVAAFAAAGGIPAALVALAAFAIPFGFIFRRYRSAPPWRRAAAWGVAAFSLHMLMEMDYLVPGSVAAYLLLAASLLVPDDPAPPEKPSRTARVLRVAVILLLCGVYFVYPVRNLRGDLAYARFCAVVVPEPGTRWLPPAPERIEADLRNVRDLGLVPDSPFPLEKAADCCAAIGLPKSARQLLLAALRAGGERPGVYRKLAELAERAGDAEAADRCRRKAHELFPAKYPAER
ncbi:MAG: O-antigen ligase family protein, partial [Lentisphaeria bacterium]|nr:O-antigen ligase family protein [Lentisphaeria bacterium]